MKKVPDVIRNIIYGKTYDQDTLGESRSSVLLYDDIVLKVSPLNDECRREFHMLELLDGHPFVPKVITYVESRKYGYLISERIKGFPLLRLPVEQSVRLACEGLLSLWNIQVVDHHLCRKKDSLEYIRNNAYHHRECIIQNAAPDTFGASHFKDPIELYLWLEKHYPDDEAVVFSHGDYFLPNILTDGVSVTGIIDFGQAGLFPKERDIATLIKSIHYNYIEKKDYRKMIESQIPLPIKWDIVEYFDLYDELV